METVLFKNKEDRTINKIDRQADPVAAALKTIKGRIQTLRNIVILWARSDVKEIIKSLSQDVKKLESLLERQKDDGK